MKNEYWGLNPLKVAGVSFELGYGYSKFVSLKINNKKFIPVLWAWPNIFSIALEDKTKEKVFAKVEEMADNLNFYGYARDVRILDHHVMIGYPSIKFGKGPWAPENSSEIGKAEKYKKMNILTKWKAHFKRGFANFTYDIWMTKSNKGKPKKDDLEVMVWLDYDHTPPYERIGETKDFIIAIAPPKKFSHHRIDFYLKNKSRMAKFDLKELIKICKKSIKSLDSYYIRSIELGTEFTKNTEVETKLFKLEFDFKK